MNDSAVVVGVVAESGGRHIVYGSRIVALDFGFGPLASFGQRDAFIASFDEDWAHVWGRTMGSTENDRVRALAQGSPGSTWVALDVGAATEIDGTSYVPSLKLELVAELRAE